MFERLEVNYMTWNKSINKIIPYSGAKMQPLKEQTLRNLKEKSSKM